MLFRNARLVGAAFSGAAPVDIRLQGDRIVGVAPSLPNRPRDDGPEEMVDLGGRWVLPGLWDSHVHFTQWALRSGRLDVSAARSAAETASRVGEALASTSAVPFVAAGFRDALWSDSPSLATLDAASGEHPVVVVGGDLHAVWVNSAALRLFGLPPSGTGLLREDDAFAVVQLIDAVEPTAVDPAAADAADRAARRGVVGIVDYEMAWNLDAWNRRMDAGLDSLRVEFGIYTEDLDRAIDLGLRTGRSMGKLLTVAHFKVLTDGSLNTRTAYCYEPYPRADGSIATYGMLTVSQE